MHKFFKPSNQTVVSGRYGMAFQRTARELALTAEQRENLERAPATQDFRVVCCSAPRPIAPSDETWFIR